VRRPIALALLFSALALFAAGCGGGGAHSDKKADEAYANGVCTAIGGWASEVKSLATVPSGGITKTSIDAKLSQFETATKQLVSQIKAVPAPNSSEGQTAKEQIDRLATQIQSTSASVKSAASKLPANATLAQMVSELSNLLPQFQNLKNSAQSTLKTLQSAGGSLADAFKSERACKELG
jgi:hypothetical protein